MTPETLIREPAKERALPEKGTWLSSWPVNAAQLDGDALETSYSVRRWFVDDFLRFHLPQMKGCVLDVGGHGSNRRGRFNPEEIPGRRITLNLAAERRPDCQADASALPLQEACADVLVCSEVLEHLENPTDALREFYRVLRPGGLLLMTVPFLYRIHAHPGDFGRYTHSTLSRWLGRAGFSGIRIYRQGLWYSVIADMAKQAVTHRLIGRSWLGQRLLRRAAGALQRWAFRMEAKPGTASQAFAASFTTGYGIVAVKEARP